MTCSQGKPSGPVLASKPSSSFSTHSSAASATSAGTSRSGGSKLLFGEIDTSSDRSSELYASVCSFVLCDSSTFLKFWLEDKCRETFLSHVPKDDLASLRLACHDFSVRAAPALFNDLTITFRTSTFTKPARLAALDRLGFYVEKLTFKLPHSAETFLPPLVDPETGQELSFTYTPQMEPPTPRRPKYGDIGTTEILTRQWPTLFHAATNVPAFIRAFSAFVNLTHLTVSCPDFDGRQRYRRSIVDFALISLRIAIEKNSLNALEHLSLSPIHPGGLMHFSPLLGYGATPRSVSRWSRIKHLTIHTFNLPASTQQSGGEPEQFKLLQTYIRNFQNNLTTFTFRWVGQKGEMPIQRRTVSGEQSVRHNTSTSPTETQASKSRPPSSSSATLHLPKLRHADFANVQADASHIAAFATSHKRTIEELNFEDVELTSGTWDEALQPLTKLNRRRRADEDSYIPIMLSPTLPAPMERVEVAHHHDEIDGRKRVRMSRWLSTRKKSRAQPVVTASMGAGLAGAAVGATAGGTKKAKEALLGCEGGLRKVLRGSGFLRRAGV